MKRLNLGRAKPLLAGRRLTRTALLIGVAGATAGSLLFGATAALADPVGTDPTPGTLTFTDHTTNLPVTSGPGTELLNWNTSDACPSPNNVSAALATFDPDTNTFDSLASGAQGGPGPYAGQVVDVSVANLYLDFTDQSSPTFEVAVVCSNQSGGALTGTFVFYQYAYITYNATANTFTISATNTGPPKTATTTALTSKDTTSTEPTNTAETGDSVTFTAAVTDADSSTPAGSVTFQSNGSNIGTEPVTVGALSGGGTGATVSTMFPSQGSFTITATFTPSNTSTFSSSSATLTEVVQVAGAITAQVPENLTVPQNGTFSVSVDTSAIPLVAATGSYNATGDFGTQSPAGPNSTSSTAGVEVTDSRNTFPGWSVTGQTSNFTLGSTTIPANQLGWAPNTGETFATSGTGEATLGSAVTPAAPGLGTTPATLISAPAGGGFGTFDASALLTLLIPTSAPPGAYTGTLTITALTSAP